MNQYNDPWGTHTPNPFETDLPPHRPVDYGQPKRQSMIGIASLVLSIFSGLLTIVMFVAAGILGARNPEALDDDGPAAIVLGLGIIAFMFGSLIAIGLGVGNLFESHRTKIFGILGLTFGTISFLGTLALLLLGMMMQ
jgi:hypothetical protein